MLISFKLVVRNSRKSSFDTNSKKSPTEIIEHSLINKEYINHQNSSVISLVWTKNKYTGDCTSNR